MKLLTMLFSIYSGLAANSCLSNETTLLQTKIRTTSMAKDHATDPVQELAHRVNFFEQNPNILTDDERQVLNDTMSTLELEFVGELTRQHDLDMTLYTQDKARHQACITHKDRRLHATTGDVTIVQNAVTAKRAKHQACRKAEASFQSYRALAETVGDASFGAFASVSGHGTSTFHNDEAHLCSTRTSAHTDLVSYNDLEPVGTKLCDSEQQDFEQGFCSWVVAKTSACMIFDECITTVGLSTQKDNLEDRCSARRAAHLTILNLNCHLQRVLGVFETNDTVTIDSDTDECDLTVAPNPSPYQCNLDPVPTPLTCSTDVDITNPVMPSTTVSVECTHWRNQEYNADAQADHFYGSEDHTSVPTCQTTCNIPTEIEVAEVSENCVDLGDLSCEFYSQHSDACGLYPVDGAEINCCACGGGVTPHGDAVGDEVLTPGGETPAGHGHAPGAVFAGDAASCPAGSSRILDEAACENVAAGTVTVGDVTGTGIWQGEREWCTVTPGCVGYVFTTRVYFNICSTEGEPNDYHPVLCIADAGA